MTVLIDFYFRGVHSQVPQVQDFPKQRQDIILAVHSLKYIILTVQNSKSCMLIRVHAQETMHYYITYNLEDPYSSGGMLRGD